jgi:hypothetical protein
MKSGRVGRPSQQQQQQLWTSVRVCWSPTAVGRLHRRRTPMGRAETCLREGLRSGAMSTMRLKSATIGDSENFVRGSMHRRTCGRTCSRARKGRKETREGGGERRGRGRRKGTQGRMQRGTSEWRSMWKRRGSVRAGQRKGVGRGLQRTDRRLPRLALRAAAAAARRRGDRPLSSTPAPGKSDRACLSGPGGSVNAKQRGQREMAFEWGASEKLAEHDY